MHAVQCVTVLVGFAEKLRRSFTDIHARVGKELFHVGGVSGGGGGGSSPEDGGETGAVALRSEAGAAGGAGLASHTGMSQHSGLDPFVCNHS